MTDGEVEDRNLLANQEALARVGAGLTVPADTRPDGEIEVTHGLTAGVLLHAPVGPVRMHSARDPRGEAAGTLPRPLSAPLVVVVGAGAGYALDALEAERYAGKVLVLEPSFVSLLATLRRRDLSAAIEAGSLRVLSGPGYASWPALMTWIGDLPSAPAVVIQPVLARQRPGDVRAALEVLKKLLFSARANEAARRAFAPPYLRHTLANLAHLEASRDVGVLRGAFEGMPACVLAAGPSLNRNLEDLRPKRDGFVVIAVDTALRPCLAAGITPDLVVAVDPGVINLRHLQVPPVDDRAWLVADPSVAPGSFAAFGGRVFTFRVDRHHPWPWLQAIGIERSRLQAWGSVLMTALDLAETLGCRPIALAGADFAYTDGQPYCRGTAYEEDWERHQRAGLRLQDVWNGMKRQPVVLETGIDGNPVETSSVLLAFRDRIEQHCRSRPPGAFVNVTGRGLLRGLDGDLAAIASAPRDVPEILRRAAGPAASSDRASESLLSSLLAGEDHPWAEWVDTAGTPLGTLLDDLATAFPDRAAALRDAYQAWRRRPWGYPSGAGSAPPAPRADATRHFSIHEAPIPAGLQDLRTERWQRINRRRLEHLAGLHLPLHGRSVLELGPGIGDLTDFFLERGCTVTAVDGRAEMLDVMQARFAGHPDLALELMNLDPPERLLGEFDVVHCYGMLYLISDLVPLLDWVAASCNDLFLLETIVVDDERHPAPVPLFPGTPGPAGPLGPHGSLPPWRWLWGQLARRFPHVYAPSEPPAHEQYPRHLDDPAHPGTKRAVFIGARRPLASHLLLASPPVLAGAAGTNPDVAAGGGHR